ncbi:dihydropteroate synthase [Parvularcula sp. IMCC14364]|uniref:dihydropteroate synthase n=1 Tax=Parvularcula sp. IMCC14364 TaxID=3067902 RepID=UPI00274113A6|nr:dihydropteroate synthase [Parvularcula sp. IMCC14364]
MTYRIMGIVNVTPDSFSDGGQHATVDSAIAHALRLADDGADILDIGGESTRPGAETVPLAEEYARVIPVIEKLAAQTTKIISIDTRRPEIAQAAMEAGAGMWNDVSALGFSERSLGVARKLKVPVVLMHAQGTPETMQDNPRYTDVVQDIKLWLARRIHFCEENGLPRERIIIDPGIGFGKTLEHNLAILGGLSEMKDLGCPVLLGASRKSFIGMIDKNAPAGRRLGGSIAAALTGVSQGAEIFRVHDVAETRQALATYSAMKSVNC